MSATLLARLDAAIDALDDDVAVRHAIVDVLDQSGDWDWSTDYEHGQDERVAVVESTGAWWAVIDGSEREVRRCATSDEAWQIAREWISQVS